jgi:hypothetical protein
VFRGSLSLCPTEIPHELTWSGTRAVAMGNQGLTASAAERPVFQFVISLVSMMYYLMDLFLAFRKKIPTGLEWMLFFPTRFQGNFSKFVPMDRLLRRNICAEDKLSNIASSRIIYDSASTCNYAFIIYNQIIVSCYIKNWTPWPESASELCRPSDRRLSDKLVQIFADRWSHVVSVRIPTAVFSPF